MLTTTALLFALNLFALPMDVQWGDPGVFTAQGLFSRAASRGVMVEPGIARPVLFRRAGQTAWSAAKGPDGQPLSVALEAGGVYVFVVRANGNGELVRVEAPSGPGPKVLFVNAAKGPVAVLELGVSAQGQGPGWTAFVEAPAGTQTLVWSWPTMPPGTATYKAASTQPGLAGTTVLQEGRWYVAVVTSVYGLVTDITP